MARHDGRRPAATDVEFLMYSVSSSDSPSAELIPCKIDVSPDGKFRDAGELAGYATLEECRNGKLVSHEIPETRVYIVKAAGCKDARVIFSPDWVPHDIELNCEE
jgi:hypothetical protein